MRWNGFSPSLVFAAAAAGGYALFALAAPLSPGAALAVYGALVVPVYVAGLGPRLSRDVVAAFGAALLCGIALVLLPARDALLVSALALGLARSGMLYRARFARAVVLEGLLLAGGLALARHLLGGSVLTGALAVWGFFVVQSVFFLVGGVRERAEAPEHADPFDDARTRALSLLEES